MFTLFRFVLFFFLMGFLGSNPAVGSGGSESPQQPAAHGEAKKNPEWMDLSNQILSVKTKIKMKEELVQKLIEEKSKAKTPKEANEIVKTMISEHRELQKAIADYEEKRNLLQYRFPEMGLQNDRKYERIDAQSLEAMETQWGLMGKIKKTTKKVKEKYKQTAGKKKNLEEEGSETSRPNSPGAGLGSKDENPLAEPLPVSH